MIRMIYHFLDSRTMVIRNGFTESTERTVTGGSPQGTKLGNVLFCLTVEGIHEKWNNNQIERPISPIAENTRVQLEIDSPLAALPAEHRRQDITSTPCLNETINRNFSVLNCGITNKLNCISEDSFETTMGL